MTKTSSFYVLGLLLFNVVCIQAQTLPYIVWVDTFAIAQTQNVMNREWFTYADGEVGGQSTIEKAVSNDSISQNQFLQARYVLKKGIFQWDPFAAMGCNISSKEVLKDFQALSYRYKGSAHSLILRTDNITDYCYYQLALPASKGWKEVIVPLKKLKQPTWGKKVDFKPETMNGWAWQVTGKEGERGSIALDDICLLYVLPPSSDKKEVLTQRQCEEDFKQMVDLIQSHHPAPYDFCPKEDFESFIHNQAKEIRDSLCLLDFRNILSPIVAKIQCGHSSLRIPIDYWENNGLIFPLSLFIEEGKAYVFGDTLLPKGTEIISINTIPIAKAIVLLKSDISTDAGIETRKNILLNTYFWYFFGDRFGRTPQYLIRYRLPGSKTEKIGTWKGIKASGAKPLQTPALDLLQDQKTAVLTIPHFNYYSNRIPFYTFIDSGFAVLDTMKVQHLILDLRNNSGGDPFCSNYLLAHLLTKPYIYYSDPYAAYRYQALAQLTTPVTHTFKGDLSILINGGCFSTTGQLCSLLKYHKRGTFVGEETGGTFTCHAATKSYVLQHSELTLELAQQTFATAVNGISSHSGIFPDLPVQIHLLDRMALKDPVMQKALEQGGK